MTRAAPLVCQLAHNGFRMLGEPVFRLSEGSRVASMVVQLHNQEAVLPLRSVAREFGLAPDSPDGQMLALIEQALDFVVALRIGDRLPSELNGGEASWKPTEQDRQVAASRVWHDLVRCVFARMGQAMTISGGLGWEDVAGNRIWLAQAVDGAVAQLHGPDANEVTSRTQSIIAELACIETMRRGLIRGMEAPHDKLLQIRSADLPPAGRATTKQVQDLARRGLQEITNRFDEVDGRLDDMLAMLRETPAAIAWLRRQRDWLFRTKQAWEPVFADWAGAPKHADDFLWQVVERTYLFVAPRFMSFQEWTLATATPEPRGVQAKVW
jgi:hypothetical protein